MINEEEQKIKSGIGAILIILIAFAFVASAAMFKVNNVRQKNAVELFRWQSLYDEQKKKNDKIYTSMVERDNGIIEQQRKNYNELSLMISGIDIPDPYAPTADCISISYPNSPNYTLSCKRR